MNLKECIAPDFFKIHTNIKNGDFTHYWLKGGRGSGKSSFVSIEIILGLMKEKDVGGVAIRRVGNSLKDSVFAQLLWAIEKLSVKHLWDVKTSSLELTFKPNGNKILFRGADDVSKIKSTKLPKGYIKYVWYEECDEFRSYEDILSVNQSLLRGGESFRVFYTFNPPRLHSHWINKTVSVPRDDKIVFHSTYLMMPLSWLGKQFFLEAENLKNSNKRLYDNQYLGIVTGGEGLILPHFKTEELKRPFEVKFLGQDFGFNHANAILELCFYENLIYVSKELYVRELDTHEIIKLAENIFDKNLIMWCDSAEPDRIKSWRKAGWRATPVSKEVNSISAQIDFLKSKELIINPACVNTINEISSWNWIKDKVTGEYTDKPVPFKDDAMAALRYGTEYMRKRS